jgi:predicted RNA-binding protein
LKRRFGIVDLERMKHYLIEFRFHGYAKKYSKKLCYELAREIMQDRLDAHLLSKNQGFFDGKMPL